MHQIHTYRPRTAVDAPYVSFIRNNDGSVTASVRGENGDGWRHLTLSPDSYDLMLLDMNGERARDQSRPGPHQAGGLFRRSQGK